MQINSKQGSINVSIPYSESFDYANGSKPKSRKRLSSFLLILLLLCFGVVTSIYVFVSLEGPKEITKLASYILNNRTENIQEDDQPRVFNESTLSFFSGTELSKLGVLPLPQNFQIQEEYKGIKLVKSENDEFSDIQISLLKMFIDLSPQKLLTPGPTAIVTFKRGEIRQGTNYNPNTAAFASGPYIFFNDNSFDPNIP